MRNYELSDLADLDLEDIIEYSESKFGLDQTIEYYSNLMRSLDRLGEYPLSGVKRDEIRKGLRSTVSGSHIIFYRVKSGKPFVLRILHHSQDAPLRL